MTISTRPHARTKMCCALLVAVLFLCFAARSPVAAKHRCIFDRIARKVGPLSTAAVLELPRQGRSGVHLMTAARPGWAPIRFSVFTKDMTNNLKYCTAAGQQRPMFDGRIAVCQQEDIFTRQKRAVITRHILPRATRMHAERLLLQRETGRIRVPMYTSDVCSQFTVPHSHHTQGVENTDMVLYASAGPIEDDTLAWATPCSVLQNKRPVVGVINFSPRSIVLSEHTVRISAHEIAHALGFNFDTMQTLGMVRLRSDVRDKPKVYFVASPKTVVRTQVHYNCSTAFGMELEDEGGEGTAGSHWERRNAKDELMAGVSGIGYYTALTMAAFEDMKFFKARWGTEETMSWGRTAGCSLLTKKCLTGGKTAHPDMFCEGGSSLLSCTSDRLSLGFCAVVVYDGPLPAEYHYFANRSHGGRSDGLTDLCPTIEPYENTRCTDGVQEVMPGSRITPYSRCLKGDNLYYKGMRIGDVCAEVWCNNGSVRVRHLGDDRWYDCPAGYSIRPGAPFSSGMIACPNYAEVCFERAIDRRNAHLAANAAKKRDLVADASAAPTADSTLLGEQTWRGTSAEDVNERLSLDLGEPWITVDESDDEAFLSGDGRLSAIKNAENTFFVSGCATMVLLLFVSALAYVAA